MVILLDDERETGWPVLVEYAEEGFVLVVG